MMRRIALFIACAVGLSALGQDAPRDPRECVAYHCSNRECTSMWCETAEPQRSTALRWTTAALLVATAADVYYTDQARRTLGDNGYEANPIMRPFVNAGPAAFGGVSLAVDLVTIRSAWRCHRRNERGCWIIPLGMTLGHAVGAAISRQSTRDYARSNP